MKSLLKRIQQFLFPMVLTLSLQTPALAAGEAAARLPLFIATSNAFPDTLDAGLTVDINTEALNFDYLLNGSNTSVPLENLSTGIVLFQSNGLNVATLTSKSFDTNLGGPLTLTYLNDGISGVYKNFLFEVTRQGQTWRATAKDANGISQPFTTMFLTAKKIFGKVVGIDRISVK